MPPHNLVTLKDDPLPGPYFLQSIDRCNGLIHRINFTDLQGAFAFSIINTGYSTVIMDEGLPTSNDPEAGV